MNIYCIQNTNQERVEIHLNTVSLYTKFIHGYTELKFKTNLFIRDKTYRFINFLCLNRYHLSYNIKQNILNCIYILVFSTVNQSIIGRSEYRIPELLTG